MKSNGIISCCRGRTKLYAGFIWEYDGTSPYTPPEKDEPKDAHEVYQYSQGGEFLNKYINAAVATRTISNSKTSMISDCCNGKREFAYGFKWSFEFLGDSIELPKYVPQNHKIKGINQLNETIYFDSITKGAIALNIARTTFHRKFKLGKPIMGYIFSLTVT